MPELHRDDNDFVSNGGALEPSQISLTLGSILDRAASSTHQGIVHIDVDGAENFQPYAELKQEALQILNGLKQRGVNEGDHVLFQLEYSRSFIPTLWGCFLGGFIPVPLAVTPSYDPKNAAVKKLFNVWEMLGKPITISESNGMEGLQQLSKESGHLDFQIESVETLRSHPPLDFLPDLHPRQQALLLLTSGSTGLPKGVTLTHQNLLSMTAGTVQMNGFTASDVTLNWMPLDHVGSIVFLGILSVDLGAKQIHIPTEAVLRQPLKWLDLIQDHRASISWAPNFAFSLLNQQEVALSQGQYDLSSMKFLVNAGEQVAFKTVRRFLELLERHQLPGNALRPAFGMSETCSGITWSSGVTREQLKEERSYLPLGRPIPGASIRITDPQHNPVPEGTVGLLQVKGPSVTSGYHNNPEKNQEVFLCGGWFVTGDMGYLENGELVITGREKQDIIINGINYPAHELETAVEDVEGVLVSFTAAFSVSAPETETEQLVILFSPEPDSWTDVSEEDQTSLLRTIRSHLVQHVGIAPSCVLPVPPERIPKTSIGKIQHNRLKKEFEQGEFDALVEEMNALLAAFRPQTGGPGSALEQKITELWEKVLGLPEVGVDENFFELGGHSVVLIQVHKQLELALERSIAMTDLFKYPTVRALAQFLSEAQPEQNTVSQAAQARAQRRTQVRQSGTPSAVAVIGMACRFPGANNIEEFWENLRSGVESISFFTDEEMKAAGVDPRSAQDPRYVKASPILKDAEGFDASFFGYSTKEAELMDPQQRLFLEVVWEAFEHAGYNPLDHAESIGLYAGASMNTYLMNNVSAHWDRLDTKDDLSVTTLDSMGGFQMMVANDKDYLPTRVSYKLNLNGPSINVQTACSTGLVAIHLACQSLLAGECDMVIAGCSSVQSPQKVGHLFQEGMIVTPDGHCRAFDAQAQGTIFGSGVGAVLLKPLDAALNDQDSIYAVIKGSAVNNDGGVKMGYMAPSQEGQSGVVSEAIAVAGVPPESIRFVEAHGTGTEMGDPIEVGALTQAFRAGTEKNQFCALGSVKTNVGHLQISSGIVGFMKTALALYHKEIPPTLHFQNPNPQIDFERSPFYVNTETLAWEAGETPRRAGVNSLGIGGTNAHMILEEAPSPGESNHAASSHQLSRQLLTLSAKTPQALKDLVARFQRDLLSSDDPCFFDLCFTSHIGRAHFEHRLAVVASTVEELKEKLPTAIPHSTNKIPAVAFLFTGQGSQYPGMAQELYQTEARFRETLDRCDAILRDHLEIPLLEVLFGDSETERIHQTAYTQPALFSVEYALADLWQSWGIIPTAVMGHSVGEYVAACVAGVFSLEDGLKLIASRGRLMQSLPSTGEMVAVMAKESIVSEVVQKQSVPISIAAINGPENVVLSGESAAIHRVVQTLEAEGYRTKRLNTSHAFHSALMDPILDAFTAIAHEVTFSRSRLRLVSNILGEEALQEVTTPEYWTRHIRQTVRFSDGIRYLAQSGIDVFVEMGPKPTLCSMGKACVPENDMQWLPSLRQGKSDWQQIVETVADLYVSGASVDWSAWHRNFPGRRVALPTYPFQHRRYWLNPHRKPKALPGSGHPLLGERLDVASAALSKSVIHENMLTSGSLPYLQGHQVFQNVILPGTGFLELGLAAVKTVLPNSQGMNLQVTISDFLIQRPLSLNEAHPVQVQTTVNQVAVNEYTFEVYSKVIPQNETGKGFNEAGNSIEHSSGESPQWEKHASGKVNWKESGGFQKNSLMESDSLTSWQSQCSESWPVVDFYQRCAAIGLHYDSGFRAIQNLWKSSQTVLAQIGLSAELIQDAEGYQLHPVLMDACLQVAVAHFVSQDQPEMHLPVGITRIEIDRKPDLQEVWCQATAKSQEPSHWVVDLQLFHANGDRVATLSGLQMRKADPTKLFPSSGGVSQQATDWLYELAWQPQPLRRPAVDCLIPPDRLEEIIKPSLPQWQQEFHLERLSSMFRDLHELGLGFIATALETLGATWDIGTTWNQEELRTRLGISSQHRFLLGRMLKYLAEAGCLLSQGDGWQVLKTPILRVPKAQQAYLASTYGSLVEPEVNLMSSCGEVLADLLTGKADPLERLFPEGEVTLTSQFYVHALENQALNTLLQRTMSQLLSDVTKGQTIRILEVGAGTGATSSFVFPHLDPEQTDYVFTDISPLFLDRAKQSFPQYPFLRYELLDIEHNPASQGFENHSFDLVFAANVLHTTQNLEQTLGHVKQLLVPGGMLVLLEATTPKILADLTFGFLDGWSRFQDFDRRPDYPLLTAAKWKALFADCGFAQSVALNQEIDSVEQTVFVAQTTESEKDTREWLILADESELGFRLAQKLKERNQSCVIFPEQILNPSSVRGIVHMKGLESTSEPLDSAALQTSIRNGCESLLHGVQALVQQESSNPAIPLYVITRGAQCVSTEHMSSEGLVQSPLRGLTQVIAQERSDLKLVHVDLDPASNSIDWDASEIVSEMISKDRFVSSETQVAFRNRERHVVRLQQSTPEFVHALQKFEGTTIQPNATYLITGGLGEIGLAVTQELVRKGARHLLLVGRSMPSKHAEQAVIELSQAGASLEVAQADVRQIDELKQVIQQIDSRYPLRGVIHAAGVLDDGPLQEQTWERLAHVMGPKVWGAWNLHTLTQDMDLDFWVLFSSVASLIGNWRQSGYAAANAFLDALAHYRKSRNLPALSVNWGAWAEVGMVKDAEQQLDAQGFHTIPPDQGLSLLMALLPTSTTQIGVLPMNWERFLSRFAKPPSMFERVKLQESKAIPALREVSRTDDSDLQQSTLRQQLESADFDHQQQLLFQFLQEQIAHVLGETDDLNTDLTLGGLGLDSLMSIDLKNRFSKTLQVNVPLTTFMDASLNKLIDTILDQFNLVHSIRMTPSTPKVASTTTGPGDTPDDDEIEEIVL